MQCMAANTPELERSYAEVAGRAFKRPGEMRDHILKWMKRPRYSHAHTRIVVDNGTVVGGLAIVELPVRYGDTVLKLGGISCVATDPESQKRGYGRANMEDAVAYMAQNGYDLSFLLGIRDYYYRYGYRTAIVWFECRISPNVYSAKPAPGLRVRRARKSDIPGMAALYEKNGAQCDLSVVREKKDWLWYFDFGRFSDAHVVVNSEKNIVGYLVCRGAG
ncbi:MAG TPA: GNAT family N-acetyltransferase, partial [Candidatus Latescibacteria bacterium]|nr:GNAT family N-acetyltransferase [Candidatus Latescibacterota bacterium]